MKISSIFQLKISILHLFFNNYRQNSCQKAEFDDSYGDSENNVEIMAYYDKISKKSSKKSQFQPKSGLLYE